jgi:ABC-2 type transport system permease protein
MRNTITIFKREFAAYFNSPIAYVFITFYLWITAIWFFFVFRFFTVNKATMRTYFEILPWFFLFFIPAITMRLWADEKKSGTHEILFTLPIKTGHLVLGKFLAGYLFLIVAILLSFTIPITVGILGSPDWGPIVGAYIGAILMGGVYMAVGSFASSLTRNQIVAFIIGISLCFILFIIGFQGVLMALGGPFAHVVERLSTTPHFMNSAKGVLDTADIIYAISMIAFFLFLTQYKLESGKH